MDADGDSCCMDMIYDLANAEGEIFSDAWSIKTIETTMLQSYVYSVVAYKVEDSIILTDYIGGIAISEKAYSCESGKWAESDKKLKTEQKELAGYLFSNIISDETELLRIATTEKLRGTKVADLMMEKYLTYVQDSSDYCFLEVRAGNEIAKNLYQKWGFDYVGTRKDYYASPVEDALLFKKLFRTSKTSEEKNA